MLPVKSVSRLNRRVIIAKILKDVFEELGIYYIREVVGYDFNVQYLGREISIDFSGESSIICYTSSKLDAKEIFEIKTIDYLKEFIFRTVNMEGYYGNQ